MPIGPGVTRLNLACACGGRLRGYYPDATASELKRAWDKEHCGDSHKEVTVAEWSRILATTRYGLLPGDVHADAQFPVGSDLTPPADDATDESEGCVITL